MKKLYFILCRKFCQNIKQGKSVRKEGKENITTHEKYCGEKLFSFVEKNTHGNSVHCTQYNDQRRNS